MITDAPAPVAIQPAPIERLGYTIAELARACGLSHATIRERIKNGEIQTVRIGWSHVIPRSVVQAMFPTAKL
jgi:excisionase family DNA binding protein